DVTRIEFLDHLLQRRDVTIRRILVELVVFDGVDDFELLASHIRSNRRHAFAENDGVDLIAARSGNLLRSHQRFKRCAVERAITLFDKKKYSFAHYPPTGILDFGFTDGA